MQLYAAFLNEWAKTDEAVKEAQYASREFKLKLLVSHLRHELDDGLSPQDVQGLDRGPNLIPDSSRMPISVERHSHDGEDRLEGWRIVGYGNRMFWVVRWRSRAVAVCLKRQWAREIIRDLKVAWIHEQ